jgi:hypothetical protein
MKLKKRLRRSEPADVAAVRHLGYLICRGSVYQAAPRGEIDVIQIGHRYKAVSATLRRKLGIDAA